MELGDSATQRRAGGFLAQLDALAHLEIYAATALYVRALQAAGECPSGVSDLAAGAARAYTTLGWATYEAQCLELAGETREAAALWKRMGATGELQRMHRSAGPGSPLSAREREIAALIADGTPNRVLAERFAINQRTVEKHLTSIYAKLGLRNRSELAAFVAREAAR
jgi:DNA-binding CsgD family transcriptional regulator